MQGLEADLECFTKTNAKGQAETTFSNGTRVVTRGPDTVVYGPDARYKKKEKKRKEEKRMKNMRVEQMETEWTETQEKGRKTQIQND
jgi:hypothetical protein